MSHTAYHGPHFAGASSGFEEKFFDKVYESLNGKFQYHEKMIAELLGIVHINPALLQVTGKEKSTHLSLSEIAAANGFALGCDRQTITRFMDKHCQADSEKKTNGKPLQNGKYGRLILALYFARESLAKAIDQTNLTEALSNARGVLDHVASGWFDLHPPQQKEVADLVRILSKGDGDGHIRRHFIRGKLDGIERSFLVYRYSTRGEHVVKSLLTIKRPPTSTGSWTFENVVLGSGKSEAEIRREVKGVLIHIYQTFYLLGVPHLLSGETEGPTTNNEDANFRGLATMAIEQADLDKSAELPISALITSTAASSQPIVGRAALIDLGIRSTSEAPLDAACLRLGQVQCGEIDEDFIATMKELIGFSWVNSKWSKSEEHAHHSPKELILETIDNISAWEGQNRAASAASGISNRGALETYARSGRPRD